MPTARNPKARVLFVCTGNACRSQMAEGLLRQLGDGEFEVYSAGTHPWALHPLAVRAMLERGIDISLQYAKSVDDYRDQPFDCVITLSSDAKELCPSFPEEKMRTHWSIVDPVDAEGTPEERMAVFRNVRDKLERKIERLVNDGGETSRET